MIVTAGVGAGTEVGTDVAVGCTTGGWAVAVATGPIGSGSSMIS